jgi:hypothetical protein
MYYFYGIMCRDPQCAHIILVCLDSLHHVKEPKHD